MGRTRKNSKEQLRQGQTTTKRYEREIAEKDRKKRRELKETEGQRRLEIMR